MTRLIIAYYPASSGGLSFRGTEDVLYNTAHYSESILKHKSIICLGQNSYNEPIVLEKFKQRFNTIISFTNEKDLEKQLTELNVDALYAIRSGQKTYPMLEHIPMLIHCVYDMSDPHGLVYAGVSKTVADKYNKKEYVPHMVNLPSVDENFRTILGIPQNATVFGRHGGIDTWDLQFVKNAVIKILNSNNNIYFIFAVRPHILSDITHPRLICLEIFSDLTVKKKFINTCDAMLHAQSLGESFGCSVAEFSHSGKPVITWNGGVLQEHLRILGDKCIKYNNEEELVNILNSFDPKEMKNKDWVAYQEFTPEIIIKQFDQIFLQPLTHKINNEN
jgi:hypothetical protein